MRILKTYPITSEIQQYVKTFVDEKVNVKLSLGYTTNTYANLPIYEDPLVLQSQHHMAPMYQNDILCKCICSLYMRDDWYERGRVDNIYFSSFLQLFYIWLIANKPESIYLQVLYDATGEPASRFLVRSAKIISKGQIQ